MTSAIFFGLSNFLHIRVDTLVPPGITYKLHALTINITTVKGDSHFYEWVCSNLRVGHGGDLDLIAFGINENSGR